MATTWTAGKPRNIMLATDLTPASDRAFDRAVQLATEWDAALTVCHVVEASSLRPWGIEHRIKIAETELERLLRGRDNLLKGKISRHIILGDPAERVIEHAVRGMLPKNALGRQLLRKLKVYAGPSHPHAAQKPEELPLA